VPFLRRVSFSGDELMSAVRAGRFSSCFFAMFFILFSTSLFSAPVKDDVRDYKANLDKTKNELSSIKNAIQAQREAMKNEKYKEKATTKYIQKIEKELDITRKELNVYKNNIGVLESGITDLNKRISEAEVERKVREKSVMTVMRRQYEHRDNTYIRFLFRSGGISEFIKRYKFVKILSGKNADAVEQYMILIEKLGSDKEAIVAYKSELDDVKKDKEEQWKRFRNESWEKRAVLKGIQSNIKESGKMIKELEISAKQLTNLLDSMETTMAANKAAAAQQADKEASKNFVDNKGRFPWPLDSGTILAKFGKYRHPQFKSIVENRGLHIGDRFGAPVYSISGGVVKYADWFEGYGKMIVIFHGGGFYSIYAHLSDIGTSVGAKVTAKQQIGNVGDTESFFGNELYFELRKKGEPVNPLLYLKKR
jgi:murein hydrolase activator